MAICGGEERGGRGGEGGVGREEWRGGQVFVGETYVMLTNFSRRDLWIMLDSATSQQLSFSYESYKSLWRGPFHFQRSFILTTLKFL